MSTMPTTSSRRLRGIFFRGPAARVRAVIAAFCVAVIAAGCGGGGGVDSGGTGVAPLSVASGPITGFGSVIVGGVHYDDRTASILDADGNAHDRIDLMLGMTTEIRAGAVTSDANGSAGVATSIVYASSVLGQITAIDTTAATITVLGQKVSVNATTVFDATLANGLASLAVGNIVEVYGLAGSDARSFIATRIERKTSATFYVLRSTIANLNVSTKRFDLGGLAVSYAGVAGSDVIANPVNGQLVRVRLQTVPLAGVWQATRVKDAGLKIGDHEQARIEGLITSFTASALFSVDGVPVDAARADFADGTAGLGLGVRVSVEGSVQGTTLQATRVRVKSESTVEAEGFELDGSIDSIDTAAKSFVVRGVSVGYAGAVEFRDGTASDLAVGRRVEVKGSLSAGGTRLEAQRIRFR